MEREYYFGRFRLLFERRPFFLDLHRADAGKPPTYTSILRLPRPRRAVYLEAATLTGLTSAWAPRGPDSWRRVIVEFLWGLFGKLPPI